MPCSLLSTFHSTLWASKPNPARPSPSPGPALHKDKVVHAQPLLVEAPAPLALTSPHHTTHPTRRRPDSPDVVEEGRGGGRCRGARWPGIREEEEVDTQEEEVELSDAKDSDVFEKEGKEEEWEYMGGLKSDDEMGEENMEEVYEGDAEGSEKVF